MEEEKPQSPLRALLNGSVIGVAEVTVNQGLSFIKNRLQQGKPLNHTRLSVVYRGYGVNAGSMAPITAVQTGTNAAATQVLKAYTGKELSDLQKMYVAFGAGAISGLVSCPAEMVMLHQQNSGHSLQQTTRNLAAFGWSSLYRGLPHTMIRDGGFTVGYLALGQLICKRLGLDERNKLQNALVGGVPAGLFAAASTHPFDTVKTKLQEDNKKAIYKNSYDVLKALMKEGGYKALFKGLTPRATRVASAITIMSYLNERLK